ncbi:CRIB domain-containing protein RIC10-like [Forsythia ovata]|uniref:CRIB domain-containing protein RIC10-like n=1 Tax=Forsythia ovata TaxID=205694 RepID=A0ABD1QB78_9LAMI
MGTKMKGIFQGFKYSLSQIFVVKEPEIEIGLPTDVKHVAHIGWDGPSDTAPSWMNEFKTGSNFSATSIGNSGSSLSPWSSQDFGEPMPQKSGYEILRDVPSSEISGIRKKQKRKKSKSSSSLKSSSSSASRVSKSKSKFVEDHAKPSNIEVA